MASNRMASSDWLVWHRPTWFDSAGITGWILPQANQGTLTKLLIVVCAFFSISHPFLLFNSWKVEQGWHRRGWHQLIDSAGIDWLDLTWLGSAGIDWLDLADIDYGSGIEEAYLNWLASTTAKMARLASTTTLAGNPASIDYGSNDSVGIDYGSDGLEGIKEAHLTRMTSTTTQATRLASTMTMATRLASITAQATWWTSITAHLTRMASHTAHLTQMASTMASKELKKISIGLFYFLHLTTYSFIMLFRPI
jgi:hypothetical protein